jgi:transcriptional regulator NrdR family protein
MTCPECGEKTKVIDSRSHEDSKIRRRECSVCRYRFSTVEIDEDYYNELKPINKKDAIDRLNKGYNEFIEQAHIILKIRNTHKGNGV